MPKENVDFLVIGAQKSGTTSLFKYIQQHPELYLPPQKEVNFFANEERFNRGAEWYIENYFSNADEQKLWGEVSPHYMGYKRAAARIHAAFPDIKLIAILRNPIDRAYSHYRMSVRRGMESRPFGEVIVDRKNIPLSLPETEAGDDSHYLLSFSLYGRTLENYLRYFDNEQILVLFQEDLLDDPGETMERSFSFLRVDDTYRSGNLGTAYHQGGVKRFPGLESWIERQRILKGVAKRLLRSRKRVEALRFWFEQLNVKAVKDKGPSADERRYLGELFEEDVALLKCLFSINTPWPEFE
jgi:hypothetical protein